VFSNNDIDKVLIIIFFTFLLYYDKNGIFSLNTKCKNLEIKVKIIIIITLIKILIIIM
jgi:hypothetical protein